MGFRILLRRKVFFAEITPGYEVIGGPGVPPKKKQAYSVPNDFQNTKKQGGPDRLVGPPRSESEKEHKKLLESAAPIQC